MFWYARRLEIEACPRQRSRIQGPGHRRTSWRLRRRHGEDRPTGAGKPGLQRPRNDRRFPPPGVTPVPSYGWPLYKGGCRRQVVHAFDHRKSALSEGEALAVVVESSPRSGFEGAGAPRQPQCITLGRLAPLHLAVRRRPRLSPPRTALRRAARERCRWRDLQSLRRKSVQEAFRGVLACQGPGNGSRPGKARGFRGQDTVERHGGFDVVMEKIVQ